MAVLRRQDPVGLGLRRIACERVEAGVRALTRQADQPGEASSAIREASAVMMLLAPAMPAPITRRDHALASRLRLGLAELERPAALLSRLDARYAKPPADDKLAAAVKAVRKHWSAAGRGERTFNSHGGSFDPAIYRLVADMAELRGHLGDWPADSLGDDAPPPGLRRTYAAARRLADQPSDHDRLVGLTDSLQALAHQLSVLAKACPPMLKAQRKLIARSAEHLSARLIDLDLDRELAQAMNAEPRSAAQRSQPDDDPPINDLHAALAETPAAFDKRMRAYWSAWRENAE